MSRKSALLALVALPMAMALSVQELSAQELSEEQRAEIAARIAPVGDVCLKGENCGGKPASSNTPPRASGTMAAARATSAGSSEDRDAGSEESSSGSSDEMSGAMEVSMAADDTAPAVDAATTAGPETAAIDGEAIYNQACMACHASGLGGAPVVGDVDSWTPRIAKGIEALHSSGVNGVSGTAMMAKGGRADLSDQQVMAAVDYMVQSSQ